MSCRFPPEHRINPFQNQTSRLTRQQKIKFIAQGSILVPIRLCMLTTSLATAFVCAKVATFGISQGRLDTEPLTGYRLTAQNGVRMSLRLFLFALGFHSIKLTGVPLAPKEQAPIVVCNHIAPWEPFALHTEFGVSFVAADSNYRIPVVGPCMAATQQIRLERSSSSARVAIKGAIEDRARHPTLPRVGLFPEGTTHNDSCLISFKTGAFQPKLPVQPVVAVYRWRDTTGVDPSWCGGRVSLPNLFFRLMAQWSNHLELRVLPVYVPSEAEKEDPVLYAANVRSVMAEALGVPQTEHSLEDMLLQVEAAKAVKGASDGDAVLEYNRMRRQFSFDVSDIKLFLQSYKELHTAGVRGSGKPVMRYRDFCSGLGLPDSHVMREVFLSIVESEPDTRAPAWDHPGAVTDKTAATVDSIDVLTLDLRSFLKAAMIAAQSANESELDAIFSAIDVDGNRLLRVAELHTLLRVIAPDVSLAQTAQLLGRIRDASVSVSNRDEVDFVEFSNFCRNQPLYFTLFRTVLKHEGAIAKLTNEARRKEDSFVPYEKCVNEE